MQSRGCFGVSSFVEFMISMHMSGAGIPYELLNAKPENVERESEIVAQSGRRGGVTISTNMAGRGTDILLGGNPEYMARVSCLFLIFSMSTHCHQTQASLTIAYTP